MNDDRSLVDQARRLAAEFAPRGAEIEAGRRLPDDIAASMGQAGFYRLYILERLGGLEVAPAVAARVFEALAEGDAACGWVAFIGATTGLALSRLTDEGAAEVFCRPDALVCGVFAANGVATKVPGGFRVTGKWQWGSGSTNADWIGGGCVLMEDGKPLTNSAGAPRNHMLFFPKADVISLDTWHVSGLSGTGSTAFEVKDVFVPERRASGYLVKTPPDRPLFRYPGFAILANGIAAVGLGIARASLTELVRVAGEKRRGGATLAERPHVQMEVARAEARLRAARAFYFGAIDAAWAAARTGDPVDVAHTRDLRLATNHAMAESAAVVSAMYTLAGGDSVYQTSVLQRQFRDVHVATQHFMVSSGVLETAGRLYLGLPTNTAGF
jgi:indole-3-acetate monooxygenase